MELGNVQEYWPLFGTPLAMFNTGVELPTCSRLISTVPAGGVDPFTGARAKRQVMLKVCPSGQTSPPAPGWVTEQILCRTERGLGRVAVGADVDVAAVGRRLVGVAVGRRTQVDGRRFVGVGGQGSRREDRQPRGRTDDRGQSAAVEAALQALLVEVVVAPSLLADT